MNVFMRTASIDPTSPMSSTSTRLPVITTSRSPITEAGADATTSMKPSVNDSAETSTVANASGRVTKPIDSGEESYGFDTVTCVSAGLYNQMKLNFKTSLQVKDESSPVTSGSFCS